MSNFQTLYDFSKCFPNFNGFLISVNFFSKDFFFEGLPRPIRPITKAENAKWRALLRLHRALLKLCMAALLCFDGGGIRKQVLVQRGRHEEENLAWMTTLLRR